MPTPIQWTDETWNPTVGCDLVSPGCTNCYAMQVARRQEAMAKGAGKTSHYDGTTKLVKGKPVWTGKIGLAPDFVKPLKRRKPTMYFVNSTSDLFHDGIADEVIDQIMAVIALCPQHVFQVLTKRPERMQRYMANSRAHPVALAAMQITLQEFNNPQKIGKNLILQGDIVHLQTWPLPNLWLGVSVEDQTRADERIPFLLNTPAAVRFLSIEPLLENIVIEDWLWSHDQQSDDDNPTAIKTLDWVIVGGESGPNARPMHPDWARSLRDQCASAAQQSAAAAPTKTRGTPFFFKQWGEFAPDIGPLKDGKDPILLGCCAASLKAAGAWVHYASGYDVPDDAMNRSLVYRLGKKSAGRLLDGIEHNAMPARLHGEGHAVASRTTEANQ